MDVEKIKKANTQYLGKNIIYYTELSSTQDEAKKLLKSETKNGTIVITDKQTKGRGTKGRVWYSGEAKNIAMTMIIYPNCTIEKINSLTIKIAQTIANAIKELYNIKLSIKEPNDLILNNKKISGILTESTTYRNKVKYILIGIGFNVNEIEFSTDTIDIATSLKKEYSKEYNIEDIIIKFIEKFEEILINDKII